MGQNDWLAHFGRVSQKWKPPKTPPHPPQKIPHSPVNSVGPILNFSKI